MINMIDISFYTLNVLYGYSKIFILAFLKSFVSMCLKSILAQDWRDRDEEEVALDYTPGHVACGFVKKKKTYKPNHQSKICSFLDFAVLARISKIMLRIIWKTSCMGAKLKGYM